MKILGLDFETQCLDTENTNITEVGAIEFAGSDFSFHQKRFTRLCYLPEYPPQSEEAVSLTGITDEMLIKNGLPPHYVLEELILMIDTVDYIMAYNAKFDKAVLQAACKRYGLKFPATPWLCAMTDVPYSEKFTCAKLSHRAYDHGILVHPDTLHQAIDDVDLMGRLVSKYKFSDILAYAAIPWVYMLADVPKPWLDGGVGKAKAKACGFTWQTAKGDDKEFPSKWVKRVKEDRVDFEFKKAEKIALIIMKA